VAEVIDIQNHLPEVDKDLVDTLRTMLSEAQNGRLRSYAAVYVTQDGEIGSSYYYQCTADQIALEAISTGLLDIE
jgi:hypothetical protein